MARAKWSLPLRTFWLGDCTRESGERARHGIAECGAVTVERATYPKTYRDSSQLEQKSSLFYRSTNKSWRGLSFAARRAVF